MSIWKRIVLIIAFIGFYFLLLRPMRSYTAEIFKSKIEIEKFETYSQSSVGFTIIYIDNDFRKEFAFKMPFGMFFLFSGVSLIFINAGLKDIGILFLLQLSFWLVAFICMIFGSKGSLFFLEIMDMIMSYLLPLCSLGFPAYLIIQKKSNAEMASYES